MNHSRRPRRQKIEIWDFLYLAFIKIVSIILVLRMVFVVAIVVALIVTLSFFASRWYADAD